MPVSVVSRTFVPDWSIVRTGLFSTTRLPSLLASPSASWPLSPAIRDWSALRGPWR